MPNIDSARSSPPADFSRQLFFLRTTYTAVHSSGQCRAPLDRNADCRIRIRRSVACAESDLMADTISKEHRSWNMSRIKNRDTKPELVVRSLLHQLGYRFRLHRKDLPGKPDIVLPKYKTAVFVHGCFWHRHENCRLAYIPKSRPDFWNQKFTDNIRRDQACRSELQNMGWNVLVIWECELHDLNTLSHIIHAFFNSIHDNMLTTLTGDTFGMPTAP